MPAPLQLTCRNIAAADGIEDVVRSHLTELEQIFDRLTACNVTIEADRHRPGQGTRYRVHILMLMPNHDVVVRREPPDGNKHEDLKLALREAFHSARRQLQDHVRSVQAAARVHAP